jgi:putative redox protein
MIMYEHALPSGLNRIALVKGDGNVRFTASIRGHEVPTDQPLHAGGEDSAAMPLELLAASLGTCIALYAHQFCAARGIPDSDLSVEVGYELAKAPKRISRFDIRVLLPADFPEHYRDAVERVVRNCPVHNTLEHMPRINVHLEQADTVALTA